MIIVRCKCCNKELHSTSKLQVCGCPNRMEVQEDEIKAVDLSKVIMIKSDQDKSSKKVLSNADLMYQEERRKRKVRRLDFDVR